MLRWIAILLIAALPLRSTLAAVQFCPWMEPTDQVTSVQPNVTPSRTAPVQAGEDCPGMGMGMPDGSCKLQTACTVTPVLQQTAVAPAVPAPPVWSTGTLHTVPIVFLPHPDRVPISHA